MNVIFMLNFSGTPGGGTGESPGQTISLISKPSSVHTPIFSQNPILLRFMTSSSTNFSVPSGLNSRSALPPFSLMLTIRKYLKKCSPLFHLISLLLLQLS
ncbi:hypothetical protein X975_01905, partial [Stegodyphus mimosarum]